MHTVVLIFQAAEMQVSYRLLLDNLDLQIVSSLPLCYTNFRRKENISKVYSKGIMAFVWSLQGKREVHLLSHTLTPPARRSKSGLWPASLSHS